MTLFYYQDRYLISIKSRLQLLFLQNKYKRHFALLQPIFQDKYGLEIGGPSKIFTKGYLPVYSWANSIDGCNFSNKTLWEGSIDRPEYSYYPEKTGKQFILDASDLNSIKSSTYDFLLSSHSLEHIANPLKALQDWIRVLTPGGHILLVLPDRRFTFDRKRVYTSFEHLLQDYQNDTQENDMTHLPEILNLHDLSLDPLAGRDFEAFKRRCEQNLEHRGMHHHVFLHNLLKQMLEHFQVRVIDQYFVHPFHQIIIGKKSDAVQVASVK